MTNTDMQILNEIHAEVIRAKSKHPGDYNSFHEAYAVLLEEVDELWDDIKADKSPDVIRKEAVQVAAVAFRLIKELA